MKIVIAHNNYLQAGGEDVMAEQEAGLLREHGHSVFEYRRSNLEIEQQKGREGRRTRQSLRSGPEPGEEPAAPGGQT